MMRASTVWLACVAAVLMGSLAPAVRAAVPDAQVTRGEYLARISDCGACHTVQGGAPFAGGRAIDTPFGTLYTPNITPDAVHGIGAWSPDDFYRAMHDGVAPGGRLLYPAFPFPSYTRATRADVDAIFAYLRSLPAVATPNRAATMRFPYSLRPLLTGWRVMFFSAGEYQPQPAKSTTWNRGAYLVQGLAHCNECHTPRNWLGATQADEALAGSPIPGQHWYAPDLSPRAGGGLEGWTAVDLTGFLTTGMSRHGFAFGPMAEVVRASLQHLADEDAEAIATYLLDPPSDAPTPPVRAAIPTSHRAQRMAAAGETIYRKQCADCHGDNGEGVAGVYPPLAGNASLLGPDVNAIRAVLLGGFTPATAANPRPYSMPPFAPRFSDEEVAQVVTYIRRAWGNNARSVLPTDVATYRSVPER